MRFCDWAEKRQLRKISAQSENQNLIRSGTRPLKVCSQGLFSPYLKTLRQSRFSSRLGLLPLGHRGCSFICPSRGMYVLSGKSRIALNKIYANFKKGFKVSTHISREVHYYLWHEIQIREVRRCPPDLHSMSRHKQKP